jgi:calcineurin-like phosphoesterase family protein
MRLLGQNDWIFTDPHFNHHRLVEWGDRPEGFESLIDANWKRRVGTDDTVYCLGDVCFKGQAEAHAQYIQSNPGYKVLILGNHDKQKEAWYLSHGWNEVHTTLMLSATANGRHTRLLLSHTPQADDGKFDLNVHGHFHANLHRLDDEVRALLTKRHMLLSLEAVNYDFVLLDDLINGRIEQPLLAQLNEGVA